MTTTVIRDGSTTQQYVRSNVTGLLVVYKDTVPDDTSVCCQAWATWLEEYGLPRNVLVVPVKEYIQQQLFYENRTVHLVAQG